MRKPVFFTLNASALSEYIRHSYAVEPGELIYRHFPDGETYLKIDNNVQNQNTIVFALLNQPNAKLWDLLLLANLLRKQGAKEIRLMVPYLPYMRQDKAFSKGESLSAHFSAEIMSQYFDRLMTIEPHLHRIQQLESIFSIPVKAISAAKPISGWIKKHVEKPLLIGPDQESEPWIKNIAENIKAPSLILTKNRFSPTDVQIEMPKHEFDRTLTPVIVDDIISTGHTLKKAILLLSKEFQSKTVCIGVHALCKDSLDLAILSCNTLEHPSNQIDLSTYFFEQSKAFGLFE